MKNMLLSKKTEGFQVVEKECIWMKAGVVNFRLCDNLYDCYNCRFDNAMRIAMGKKIADVKVQTLDGLRICEKNIL